MARCLHCHSELATQRRFYCSRACQGRAYRRRRAGLPQDACAGDARRGPGVRLRSPLTLGEYRRAAARMNERVLGHRLSR